jgi:EAL domain-containing protein (putative c-di-GMP-specific phosphodiesterase class I)
MSHIVLPVNLHRRLSIPARRAHVLSPAAARATGGGIEHALHRAVRKSEFCLFYQPILNLRSNRVIGAEALLRWRKGSVLLSAGDFIEALEASDVFDTVSHWVLREACHDAAWIQKTLDSDFRIAVNVAPQQLAEGKLARRVNEVLRESGCNPHMLDLEITERSSLSDTEDVQATLGRFRDQGIMITIDDFGSGHANFRCLHRFPVTHLKIDRYYCRHARAQVRMLEPLIAAAHRAGIICTGEGIETEAQLALLKSSSCDEAQGFCIGRPMDFHALVNVLEEQAHCDAWSARGSELRIAQPLWTAPTLGPGA